MSYGTTATPSPRPRRHDYSAEARNVLTANPRPVLCTAEAAALILNCSSKHVRTLLSDGVLRGCRLGKTWRVNVSSLFALIGND